MYYSFKNNNLDNLMEALCYKHASFSAGHFYKGTLHFVGGLQYICERTTGNVILLQENANALKQDYATKAVNGP